MEEVKRPMIKLKSVNCWAGETGICACDEIGNPIETEIRLYESLDIEWFALLSAEDKNLVNLLINNK
jgi:hypothetical protein